MNADERLAIRRLVDRGRRRALLVAALAHGNDRRLGVDTAMAIGAGIDPVEAAREARRVRRSGPADPWSV